MLHIQKGEEPKFLIDFKRRYPSKTYESKEFQEYRAPLNEVLRNEQKGLCAYCCGRVTKHRSHNEHIEPQHPGKYSSHRSLDYQNIVASCNNQRTCGIKKENDYDAKRFISPLNDLCENNFTYHLDGSIDGDIYTIDLLNLDDYELKNARKAVVRSLQSLSKEDILKIYMNEDGDEYPAFFNVIKWYWHTL
ncbi:MAG: TIGR02646 family protein [Lachnospiraceae bacterium]|nr:TIGR02646 family protein [Lachnospiraceae bacterium]